jgi:hypothetical protein
MQQSTVLVIAVLFVFGGAMVAEFSGAIDRDLPVMTEDGTHEMGVLADIDESKLRIGVMGGFVVACIFILMRATGEYF